MILILLRSPYTLLLLIRRGTFSSLKLLHILPPPYLFCVQTNIMAQDLECSPRSWSSPRSLMEDDLAYQFKSSQPTVSRIITIWVNFLYYKLKEIPIWPSREQVQLTMPEEFLCLYPNTRIIIDAMEIFIQSPSDPSAQQLLFLRTKIATLQKCWQELHLPELFRLYQTCMVVLYRIGNCL